MRNQEEGGHLIDPVLSLHLHQHKQNLVAKGGDAEGAQGMQVIAVDISHFLYAFPYEVACICGGGEVH